MAVTTIFPDPKGRKCCTQSVACIRCHGTCNKNDRSVGPNRKYEPYKINIEQTSGAPISGVIVASKKLRIDAGDGTCKQLATMFLAFRLLVEEGIKYVSELVSITYGIIKSTVFDHKGGFGRLGRH